MFDLVLRLLKPYFSTPVVNSSIVRLESKAQFVVKHFVRLLSRELLTKMENRNILIRIQGRKYDDR